MNNNVHLTLIEGVKPIEPVQQVADLPTPKALANIEAAAHYRLLIEEGPRKGSFVYKTLDSQTGEIIRQFPREQLVRLAERPDYDKGAVINTLA
jgi:flagellar protein FlaG